MARRLKHMLRKRALRVEQNTNHPLYLLSLTGDELLAIAEISRVSRDTAGKLLGYQRAEVKRHVQDIVAYLNTENIIFPNSIILAFSASVKFRRSRGPQVDDRRVAAGVLDIPVPRGSEKRPAWIVDGQQRALAISKSHQTGLPIPVNAFVADEVDLQRDQFIRINNTKPLPRGLLTELLPEVTSPLPGHLAARQLPSAICDSLNRSPESPFYGLIRRASSTADERSKAIIADSSLVRMVQESLSTPSGCLFPYRNMITGETDTDGIWSTLIVYWKAVKRTFPDDWGKPPAKSRLMHGAGIRAMGRLMDRVMTAIDARHKRAALQVERDLRLIAPFCHWTTGRWEELGNLNWDEIQNVPRHIRTLSNHLIRAYVQAKAGTR